MPKKLILTAAALFLITAANAAAQAQVIGEKDADKATTANAWRQALPQNEQTSDTPPVVVRSESRDNVEVEETAAQIEKRIIDLENRLMEAVKKRDTVVLNQLLASDFMPVGANITALQSDKTRFIDWTLKNLDLKSYTIEKTTVRVYPSTAIVTVNYKQQAVVGGAPANGDFVATDVWVKRGKMWRAVSHHVSQQTAKP